MNRRRVSWAVPALAAGLCLLGATSTGAQPAAAAAERWPQVGRQGIVRMVIAPLALARDREAHARQIEIICAEPGTCFVNFYTNSTGAELAMPLPDSVSQEPTVMFRRSAKLGAELFRWSCRLAIDPVNCF